MAKRKGKYAGLVDNLPRLANSEPKWVEKVEDVKGQIFTGKPGVNPSDLPQSIQQLLTLFDDVAQKLIAAANGKRQASALAAGYALTRNAQDVIKDMESILNIIEEAYQLAGVEQYEVEGVTSMDVLQGTVRHQAEPYAQVKDREAFRLWCIANGYERSLAMAWQSANSMCKERLVEGLSAPDGVEIFAKHKFVFTAAKDLDPELALKAGDYAFGTGPGWPGWSAPDDEKGPF